MALGFGLYYVAKVQKDEKKQEEKEIEERKKEVKFPGTAPRIPSPKVKQYLKICRQELNQLTTEREFYIYFFFLAKESSVVSERTITHFHTPRILSPKVKQDLEICRQELNQLMSQREFYSF